ncbi:ABC transporter ATP-binding protein [Alteribacillus bidgolensis]|uniref:ABC-2 type transport system ATP-binding protein n=1 Tax=Alteribacillus bidgolensis TaxID=930129 RepID=A0A1G8QK34_9BACI|nr:ABC transporter ATP-binding protein [Alteribacillus bidgolensis]SDJ05112.1 ABC-2 type transport system ATP-binding protein [Alteribacillus bidgolensis]
MSETIITLNNLTKFYDDTPAVDRLSLSIERGEIFGLLGPNGAGKSTAILMMLGLSEPASGSVEVCGINSIREPLAVKRRVGYLPDDLGFYETMTGLENILYTASLNGIPKKETEEDAHSLLRKVGLSDAAHKKAGKYSRGMRQRLGLADVLIKKPEIIILDEPTLGIDPEGVREILDLIKRLNKEENITVLLSSHHLHQVQEICDRVGIFVEGKLLAKGDIASLASQLFLEESFVVYINAEPVTKELQSNLMQLPEVETIRVTPEHLEIFCSANISDHIAKAVIESGASLTYLSQKNYGLDEIYHRYFKGSGVHEHQ